MFIEKLGKVRYQYAGYCAVCLSPSVSIILLTFGGYFVYGPHLDFLLPIMWHIRVNVLTIGIQVSGIILYLIGYRKKELEDFPSLPFATILLSLWGIFVIYATLVSYNEFMDWISQPFRREITIWDNIEYATGALKGLLWIASGLIFIVTDLHPRK